MHNHVTGGLPDDNSVPHHHRTVCLIANFDGLLTHFKSTLDKSGISGLFRLIDFRKTACRGRRSPTEKGGQQHYRASE